MHANHKHHKNTHKTAKMATTIKKTAEKEWNGTKKMSLTRVTVKRRKKNCPPESQTKKNKVNKLAKREHNVYIQTRFNVSNAKFTHIFVLNASQEYRRRYKKKRISHLYK